MPIVTPQRAVAGFKTRVGMPALYSSVKPLEGARGLLVSLINILCWSGFCGIMSMAHKNYNQ